MAILTLMRVESFINQDCGSAIFRWLSARLVLKAKGVSWEILAGPCEGFVHRLIRNQSPAEIKPSLASVRIDSSTVFRYSLKDKGCAKKIVTTNVCPFPSTVQCRGWIFSESALWWRSPWFKYISTQTIRIIKMCSYFPPLPIWNNWNCNVNGFVRIVQHLSKLRVCHNRTLRR